MRAIIFKAYGPPVVLQEAIVADPKIGLNKLLVEVRAAGVNPIDWKIRKGNFRIITGKNCRFVSAMPKKDDLLWLKQKIEEERIRIVLDRTYPLENAKEAHEYLEKGHAQGKVVLSV